MKPVTDALMALLLKNGDSDIESIAAMQADQLAKLIELNATKLASGIIDNAKTILSEATSLDKLTEENNTWTGYVSSNVPLDVLLR